MLFIIWFINLFLCIILDYKNSKFKYLIDDIALDFLCSWNFTSMKDIRRKYSLMVDLSKFTFNKKNILSGVGAFSLQLRLLPNFILKTKEVMQ